MKKSDASTENGDPPNCQRSKSRVQTSSGWFHNEGSRLVCRFQLTQFDNSDVIRIHRFGSADVRVIDAPVPDITEDNDVIIQVTGTTICGSDLHLYHGEIMTLQKGDILGHEFMGKVEKIGPKVKNLKVGQRVVASFQIACGTCRYCKEKLSSFCDRTNNSS